MSTIVEDPDVPCIECEWLAVFECPPCNELVCGRHRSKHYPHNLSKQEDPSAVTECGKKKVERRQ